ncbi:MAG: SPOR domain-containing protein [Alphaproteobacteria bacterium]
MTIELNHDTADRAIGRGYGVEERRSRPWLIGVVALAVIGAFCGIVWYAYSQGMSQGSRGGSVPVLRADPTPVRERPSEPGGMKVPHQDKLVYDQVGRTPALAPSVERMLPPPEAPIARPVAPPPASAPVAVTPVAPAVPPSAAAAAVPAVPARPTNGGGATVAVPPAPPVAAAPAPALKPPAPASAAPAPAAPPQVATGAPPTNLRVPQQQASVPAAPAAQPTPPAASGGNAYRIQLGAVRGTEAAQQEWEKLKASHGAVLGKLASQIVRVDLGEPRGVFYRIQAGSFPDADAARRTCTALKERNVSCLVVRP